MTHVEKVLAEYGLGKSNPVSEEEMRKQLERVYKQFEIKWPRQKEGIEEAVWDVYLNKKGHVIVTDPVIFLEVLKKNGIDAQLDDWKLELIHLCRSMLSGKQEMKFRYRPHATKLLLKERMITHPDDMKREYRELFLKHLFATEPPLEHIKKKVRREANLFAEQLNETHFERKLKKRLAQAMWNDYTEVRKQLIKN